MAETAKNAVTRKEEVNKEGFEAEVVRKKVHAVIWRNGKPCGLIFADDTRLEGENIRIVK